MRSSLKVFLQAGIKSCIKRLISVYERIDFELLLSNKFNRGPVYYTSSLHQLIDNIQTKTE